MWQAPTTPTPVHATVTVPGSKSQTNRALVLAALATAQGTSTISGALRSRDTDLMIGAVRTLGVTVDGDDTELTVGGRIAPPADLHVTLFVLESATVVLLGASSNRQYSDGFWAFTAAG